MAFTISGSVAVDETTGTQNAQTTSNAFADNDVTIATLSGAAAGFDLLLAEVAGLNVSPSGASVSNADASHPTGTALITGLTHVTNLAFTDNLGQPLDGDVAKFGLGAGDYLMTADGSKIYLYSYSVIAAARGLTADFAGVDEDNAVFGLKADSNGNADVNGALVFAAYLQPTDAAGNVLSSDLNATGAKVWMAEYLPIQHGTAGSTASAYDDARSLFDPLYVGVSTYQDFSLAGAPSGQNLFLMYADGSPAAGETAIVVTGKHPANQSGADPNSTADDISITTGDSVNTGQGGGATTIGTNNQMIDPNEGMYFTFVTLSADSVPLTVPNLDQNEADLESNIKFDSFLGANEAIFKVVQLQPPKEATLLLTALNNSDGTEKGNLFIDGLGDGTTADANGTADDSQVNISWVEITRDVKVGKTVTTYHLTYVDGGGSTSVPPGGPLSDIEVDFTGNTAKITGVMSGDQIDYKTDSLHNRVLIDNVGNSDANLNAAFDIGGFSLINSSTVPNAFRALSFQDDGPSVGTTGTNPTMTVDETDLATNATGNFAPNFSVDYGADGAAAVSPLTYALGVSAAGVDSLLVDTATGNHVFLRVESSQVVGREGTDATDALTGDIVFTASVDASGVVTLDQQRAVVHDDPLDPDESSSPATIAASLITLTATATDKDGDTASTPLNIGDTMKFEDDGPSVGTTGTKPTMTVDETDLATDATGNFAPNFTPTYGADGAAAVSPLTYALGVSAAGVDSLLVDTATGNHVFLRVESSQVVGREGTDATDALTGDIVFTASVDASGVVTLDQQRAVVHDDPLDPDESSSPATIAASLITLTATATDKDGDTASTPLNIGDTMKFEDDGPSVGTTGTKPTMTVDETDLATDATGNFAPNFTPTYGADGAAAVSPLTYALGVSAAGVDSLLVDTATGNHVFLRVESSQVVGREGTDATDALTGDIVFTASVDASGVVTLDQQRAVVHDDPLDPDESSSPATIAASLITLTATATDKDGDTASTPLNIGDTMKFEDDGPTAAAAVGTTEVIVDESAGNQDDDTDGATTFDKEGDGTSVALSVLFAIAGAQTDTNLPQYAVSSGSVVTSTGTLGGADGLQSTAFSLAIVGGDGTDSMIDTTDGKNILLFKEGDLVVGRYDTANGTVDGTDPAAFAIAIDQTGKLAVAQYVSLKHPSAGDGTTPPGSWDERIDLTGLLNAVVTATDNDNDTASTSTGIGDKVNFDDDHPTAGIALGTSEVTVDESVGAQNDDVPGSTTFDKEGDGTSVALATLFAITGAQTDTNLPQYAVSSGAVVASTGSDGGTDGLKSTVFSLAIVGGNGTDSLLDTTDGKDIKLFKEGDLIVGRYDTANGTVDGTDPAAFAIAIDQGGKVAVAQYVSLKHPTAGDGTTPAGSYDERVDLTGLVNAVVTATDNDNDTASTSTAIGDKINFDDDGPSLGFGNLVGTGVLDPQYGYWNMSAGTDGLFTNANISLDGLNITLDSFQLVKPNNTLVNGTSFTFAETAPSPDVNGAYHWTGSLTGDLDNNPATGDTTEHFTLTAYANGTYAIDLVEGFASTVVSSTAGGSLGAGGPDPVQTLTLAGGVEKVVFFAANPTTADSNTAGIAAAIQPGASDYTEPTLQLNSSMADWDQISSNGNQPGNGTYPFINDTYAMNVSTSGIGVNNNVLQGNNTAGIQADDESFVINPQTLLTGMKVFIDNSVGGYSPGSPANEVLAYRTYYSNGDVGALTVVTAGMLTAEAGGQVSFTVQREGSKMIDAVQLVMEKGDIKIPVIQFISETNNLADGINLGFTATIKDGDGDSASSSFVTNLAANALAGGFDYVLTGTSGADAFNIDLPDTKNLYQVNNFTVGTDKLVLLGANTYSIGTNGSDTVVDVTETNGGQHTFVTVVGVSLSGSDIATIT